MTKVSSELIYEVLKNIQERMGNMEGDLDTLKIQNNALMQQLSTMHTMLAGQSNDMLSLRRRLERVERRLDLHDPATV